MLDQYNNNDHNHSNNDNKHTVNNTNNHSATNNEHDLVRPGKLSVCEGGFAKARLRAAVPARRYIA